MGVHHLSGRVVFSILAMRYGIECVNARAECVKECF